MDYKDLNFDRQKDIYDEEFIGYINGLNESIKEHYKVSKINIKLTNEFLNFFKQQWETMKNSLNEIILNKSLSNINQILQIMDNSQNIINELIKNSTSNDKNLNLFFEDAKTLFKKMKLKRNENLVRAQRSSSHKNSRFNQKYRTGFEKRDKHNKSISRFSNSERFDYYLQEESLKPKRKSLKTKLFKNKNCKKSRNKQH